MLKKSILKVPFGINYISEWKDYVIPSGHYIVDKGVTGCGYTEMCLTNNLNVVLCSPRRLLLENKMDQHEADKNILYLKNDIKDWEVDKPKFEQKIRDHIEECKYLGKPIKFMVVYDSVKYIIDLLSKETNLMKDFYFIADEFQSIFLDSYFKADVENTFISNLQNCPNVIYLSATPMLDKYLERLDEFKNLPFQRLDWSETGVVETIRIQRKRTSSLPEESGKIIESYLKGDFPIAIKTGGEIIQSKEAVMFFNSVTEITRLIKKYKLKPEECNIICSTSNSEQVKKVEKLGKGFNVGKIPKRGETNKMFTFCTSACYIGSDFYSKCASTYIFADPNLEWLALDISLDLPQIAGRQRDRENPFKNIITIFYKTLRDDKVKSKEEFALLQAKRRKNTEHILQGYNDIKARESRSLFLTKLEDSVYVTKYKSDFISIDRKKGIPVYNKLIEIANERAFEVAQEDYQNQVSVTRALDWAPISREVVEYKDRDDRIMDEFLAQKFYNTNIFAEKMKLFCEFMDKYLDNQYIKNTLLHRIPDPRFLNYYNFLGTAGCRAISYQEDLILNKIRNYMNQDVLYSEIVKVFNIGERLSKKIIKSRIADVYKTVNIKATAKAVDINNWFEVRDTMLTNDMGKREAGFEILALKNIN